MSAGPAVSLTTRPPNRWFRLVLEPHDGRALVPISERSASLRATSTTGPVESLKALDPNRPILEKRTLAFVAARSSVMWCAQRQICPT